MQTIAMYRAQYPNFYKLFTDDMQTAWKQSKIILR